MPRRAGLAGGYGKLAIPSADALAALARHFGVNSVPAANDFAAATDAQLRIAGADCGFGHDVDHLIPSGLAVKSHRLARPCRRAGAGSLH